MELVIKARRIATGFVLFALIVSGCTKDEEKAGVTTTTTSNASGTTAAPSTLECEPVYFTPNSEDLAGDIRATGVSCEEARSFVNVAGRQTSSGGPDEVDVEGYHCVRTGSIEDPLPQSFYECSKGTAAKVGFSRS